MFIIQIPTVLIFTVKDSNICDSLTGFFNTAKITKFHKNQPNLLRPFNSFFNN